MSNTISSLTLQGVLDDILVLIGTSQFHPRSYRPLLRSLLENSHKVKKLKSPQVKLQDSYKEVLLT